MIIVDIPLPETEMVGRMTQQDTKPWLSRQWSLDTLVICHGRILLDRFRAEKSKDRRPEAKEA